MQNHPKKCFGFLWYEASDKVRNNPDHSKAEEAEIHSACVS